MSALPTSSPLLFIDSHCHLDYEDFGDETQVIIERAFEAGIHRMVNICTNLEEADAIYETAKMDKRVFATIGVHPHDAEAALTTRTAAELKAALLEKAARPRVVAIGETGLDFYYDNSPRDLQKEAFVLHLEVARALDYPLSIHTRSARKETLEMLEKTAPGVRGTIHCFSEDLDFACGALDLGFYISVSGIATFKKAQDLRDAIKEVPLNRLLLETDAPFLAPTPHRGHRNEPMFMTQTAKVLADLKGVTLEELALITTQNFYTLFDRAARLDHIPEN